MDEIPELIPYSGQARKALELTFREALRLGHNYIGTEHILLAILELEDGTGVLAGLGVDKAAAEANIGGVALAGGVTTVSSAALQSAAAARIPGSVR